MKKRGDKRREITTKELELFELIREYNIVHDVRRALEKIDIISDKDAPICVNCSHCVHQGFLYICPLYQFPEDGKIVGWYGIVHYRRKGKGGKLIKITYPDAPMKPTDCESYVPMIPRGMLRKLLENS